MITLLGNTPNESPICGEMKAPFEWWRKRHKHIPTNPSKKPKHVLQAQKHDVLDK
jgi:hypothetical protein